MTSDQNLWSRIDGLARYSLPFIITFSAVFLSFIPLHLENVESIKPMLVLGSIYYWTIYRPDLLPMLIIFVIGLFQDLLYGAPIGISAFIYLIISFLVGTQRRFFHGKTFGIVWWGFMISAILAVCLDWFIFSIIEQMILPFQSFIFKYLMSIASFPIIFVFMLLLHRLIPPRGQS